MIKKYFKKICISIILILGIFVFFALILDSRHHERNVVIPSLKREIASHSFAMTGGMRAMTNSGWLRENKRKAYRTPANTSPAPSALGNTKELNKKTEPYYFDPQSNQKPITPALYETPSQKVLEALHEASSKSDNSDFKDIGNTKTYIAKNPYKLDSGIGWNDTGVTSQEKQKEFPTESLENSTTLKAFSDEVFIALQNSDCSQNQNSPLNVGVFMTETHIYIAIRDKKDPMNPNDDVIILYEMNKKENISGPLNTFINIESIEVTQQCAVRTLAFRFEGNEAI
ncbi:MAG: hypothetical protein HYW47_03790 [Deltaproteobacteria bacterium]|nr:hypothetical protein [Deltaproteobacteria bacterium]